METLAVRGQKIEAHAVTDLVLRNHDNRPSLTSGAAPVAEEHQGASSKNTMDEMAAAITGGKNVGFSLANIPKNEGLLAKNGNRYSSTLRQKVIFKP